MTARLGLIIQIPSHLLKKCSFIIINYRYISLHFLYICMCSRSPQTLPYNSYDIVKGVSRMSLRGRVRIVRQTDHITDPRTTNVTSKTAPTKATAKLSEYIPVGYPLNPCGRTGLSGKGLLPHWGPNHCIIIAITRPDPGHRFYENLPFIQVGLLHNNQQLCLPWVSLENILLLLLTG